MNEENENYEEALEEGTLASDSLRPDSKSVDDPKSKISMMTSVLGAMHTMSKRDLTKWFDQTIAQIGHEADNVPANSEKNKATLNMKPSAASASIKEDVSEIFTGEDLSEAFKEKASTLFEAAVTAHSITETARLEEAFEERFNEEISAINEELTSKIDAYLDYVVENWMKENEVAIESTLRNEIMEEFIDGLKGLFAEHYIEVPADKVDALEVLSTRVLQLEGRLDNAITENAELKLGLNEAARREVLEASCEGLALTQQEKLKALAEGIEFDGDLNTYGRKIDIIREAYFSNKAPIAESNIITESFDGDVAEEITASVDPVVNRYVQAITRTVKK